MKLSKFLSCFFLSCLLSVSVCAQETYTMENTKLIKGIHYDMQNIPLNDIVNVHNNASGTKASASANKDALGNVSIDVVFHM